MNEEVRCTKETPWDKKTLPVLHVDADFFEDSDVLVCPHCGHSWSIGPDVTTDEMRARESRKGEAMTNEELAYKLVKTACPHDYGKVHCPACATEEIRRTVNAAFEEAAKIAEQGNPMAILAGTDKTNPTAVRTYIAEEIRSRITLER